MQQGKHDVLSTYQTVNELQVPRALAVAVAQSVFSTSFTLALSGHGDEVKSTIETAVKGGDINSEGELIASKLEDLVLVITVHEVGPGTDVLATLVVRDELQGERIAARGDTIGTLVVGNTFDDAVRGAGVVIRAGRGVPLVAGVAVGVVIRDMEPAPVGIQDNGRFYVRAAFATSSCTFLPGKRRMCLLLLGTRGLRLGKPDEQRRREGGVNHFSLAMINKTLNND